MSDSRKNIFEMWAEDAFDAISEEELTLEEWEALAVVAARHRDAMLGVKTKTMVPPAIPDRRPVEVQVRDDSTGKMLDARSIANDYNIVCAGSCYVEQFDVHPDGKHVLTIKGRA